MELLIPTLDKRVHAEDPLKKEPFPDFYDESEGRCLRIAPKTESRVFWLKQRSLVTWTLESDNRTSFLIIGP